MALSKTRCLFALILALLLSAGMPAQSQVLPLDAAVAINSAVRDLNSPLAADSNGKRAVEAVLMSAVVTSIAAHPGAARDIAAAAVAAAPGYGERIIARASAAYPGFASLFAVPQFAAPIETAPPVAPIDVAAPSTPPAALPVPTAAPPVAPPAAKDSGRSDPSLIDVGYLKSYPLNAARILSAPLRFDRSDWIDTAIVLGIGGGLVVLDSTIRDFVQDDLRGDGTDDISNFFREFGNTRFLAVGLGATYVGAELMGDEQLQETALLAEQSLLLAALMGTGIKWVTQRDRPNTGKSSTSWSPFSFDESNSSFPSGHAINAFSVASVIASQHAEQPLVAPLVYGIASLTAFSRLNQNKHWASDVFMGAAIGYFIGKTVVRYNPFNPAPGMTVRPWGGGDTNGLSLAVDY